MKRIKYFLLALVVSIMALCVPVYGESNGYYTVYDEYGNAFTINENDVLVVIYDAEGNIVSRDIQPRQIYVNGSQKEIPAGGSASSYQYSPSSSFFAGFYFVHSSISGNATTPNRSVTVKILNASTVGATTRYNVKSETFSTTESDNTGSTYYSSGIQAGCSCVCLYANSISSSRPYYNAKYVNNSSSSVTISMMVGMD